MNYITLEVVPFSILWYTVTYVFFIIHENLANETNISKST